jgi:putative PIN family toxin of toxin-antitoxin system
LIRVVFDTNILLSAFLYGGNPRELFELARARRVTLVLSPSILLEFSTVLKQKFSWEDADMADAVKAIGFSAELTKPSSTIDVLSDDADDRVLECAVDGAAQFIVSGDHNLLEPGEYQGIRIVQAKDMIGLLTEDPEQRGKAGNPACSKCTQRNKINSVNMTLC